MCAERVCGHARVFVRVLKEMFREVGRRAGEKVGGAGEEAGVGGLSKQQNHSRNSGSQTHVTRPSEANDASFCDFFIFHFFTLLGPPSSSSLLPPRPSFRLIPLFLVQHCLNHLESVKVHFPSILTKALPTDGRTNQPTDRPTDGQGLL